MPNKFKYKIPHGVASSPAYSFQQKKGGGIKASTKSENIGGWPTKLPAVRKTKHTKISAIEKDLIASGIPYVKEITDTHVILHN